MTQFSGDMREFARTTRLTLSDWRSPDEFEAILEDVRGRVIPYVLFKNPAWGFWRDAWTLGQFSTLSGADRLQLTTPSEQYPDGRVKVGSTILDVEVTEAMMPGRKRANEYAPDAPQARYDPVEDWDRRLDELPIALDRAIGKKLARLYGQKPTLLVYLNIGAYGDYREEEARSSIATIKERHAGSFQALHVLWGNKLV
ncbi:hypothetical protein [Methylobacterium aquaticum]|uniref:Uncharacterized protein n=1 Tax=Methylobacterium aquaticum TaxID=270351 RepID=A0A0C6F5W3_9HYPH|nr:hypothetical protein [Methylobacterium aquaticum]BAQ48141.1 hypothetical protein Maq22A_c26365 [Methylobacterium aquaticum]